jgi:hypothetical protein
MSSRIETHRTRLAEAREKLNNALDAIGERGDEQIYSDGAQWTLRDLAVHLALADKGHNGMVMHYAEDKEFIPPDYDIERYNRGSVQKQADMSIADARAAMQASREALLKWLETADDSVLDKKGRHATLKIMTISEILNVMAWHESSHAADIQAHLAETADDSTH